MMDISQFKDKEIRCRVLAVWFRTVFWSGLLIVMCGVLNSAYALGIRVPDQDAAAVARGNAFAATADNPSAIYYNPAGIVELREGHHARGGIYGLTLESEYEAPDGNDAETKRQVQGVPQLYYVYRPEGRWAAGIGLYAPYGLSVEWPDDARFRTAGIEGSMVYGSLTPTAALEVHRTLSIAAGPTLNFADTRLLQGLPPPSPPGSETEFEGRGWAPGYAVGFRWQPHPQHVFGLKYRSITTIDFEGEWQADGVGEDDDASAEFDFPQNIVLGWSYRPGEHWNLEFNIDWTDWERLNEVRVEQSVASVPPLQFHWESSFMYEFGVTRSFASGFFGSAGYIFSENSVPDEHFNPLVPDSDRHVLSIGGGRQTEKLSWSAAYQLAYGPSRRVDDAMNPSVEGEYEFINHALIGSIGYRF